MVRRAGPYVPERGDIVWLDVDPQTGREQMGRRPALVVSPSTYNGRVGLALFCPITSSRKGYPFETALPDGLAVSGVVLADQVRSLDWRRRKAAFITSLPSQTVTDVQAKILALVR